MNQLKRILQTQICIAAFIFMAGLSAIAEDLADVPNPLMGTNNDGPAYSRGNQYPAVTVPFGMTAWAPVTGDPASGWFFDFDDQKINAIKATHQPSPWAKDYGSFEVMAMTGTLNDEPNARASSFSRSDEVAEAYHYKVKLDDYDTTFEVAPTLRCASFNITYPATEQAFLLFQKQGEGSAKVFADERKITGQVLNGRTNKGHLYFCAIFDKQFVGSGTDKGLAYVQFATADGESVNMKIGTSWISAAQAEANLNQEIGTDDFSAVKAKARAVWNNELNRISIEGGSEAEKTIFYSCLYRGLSFPKTMWEEVDGAARYYSPYDGNIHEGKLWAGNGFWDTFRAVWPFFTVMYPELTGEMLDGWVNSYKEGSWTVKWSNPGYWDCMIGTHTDSLFADAYLKGITNFDYMTAYEASVKNATVSGEGGKGRVGLESYLKLGYVAADQTKYSAARTLEFSYGDFCVAQFAKALGKTADYERFSKQAMNYRNIFSPSVGFFRGKNADGSWRTSDEDFKPNAWGHEWIEGCAWHYIAAPMHDGEGLAKLYGDRKGLEQKIDDLFAAPTDFDTGSYGKVIHEIQEAYDIGEKYGYGQYAHGNQPAQHLIYMYNYAGRPSKTAYWSRRVMRDLYSTGVADGYGYCGDEDNGQTSLWYVFSAMGFYPAAPGFPEYNIGSPLFERITLHLENGKDFVISAAGNTDENIYVQNTTLNGRPYRRNVLKHEDIMKGGILDLTMGPAPSDWGTGEHDVPSSLSVSEPEAGAMAPVLNVPAADNSTYRGKTMFGYQGWFSHPDAEGGKYWRHWGELTSTNIEPLCVDMYPDLREYGADEKYDTPYTLPNGKPAPVFSSANPKTVMRHMKWVRDYNIDGVFQQRFLSDIKDPVIKRTCDQVVRNVKNGCDQYGRVFAMMYDGSGRSNVAEEVKQDWMHLVDELDIIGHSYLHHNGLPLVALWGFTRSETTTPETLSELIDWFHHDAPEKYRASVKLGVFNSFYLRTDYAEALNKADVLSPWYVGLTETSAQYQALLEEKIAPALKWCKERDILFVPVIYPGFSWHNLRNGGNPKNRTPRDGGNYYWMQSFGTLDAGSEAMYIAMFDEVDEATAMFKVAENKSMAPVEGFWLNLDADGYKLPSDWYLRLAGKTAAIVRGDIANSADLGTPAEGIMTLYPQAGGIRFVFPDFAGQTALEISLDGGTTWPHSTPDNAGHFVIGSLPEGTVDVYVRHPGLDTVPMGKVDIPAPGKPAARE